MVENFPPRYQFWFLFATEDAVTKYDANFNRDQFTTEYLSKVFRIYFTVILFTLFRCKKEDKNITFLIVLICM